MLRVHAELAETVGVDKDKCFVMDNGDTIVLAKHKVSTGYPVEHGVTYIDGKDINGLADTVINDRKRLTEDGMLIIAVSIDSRTNDLLMEPSIYNRGIIQIDIEKTLNQCKEIVVNALQTKLKTKTSFAELKNVIKEAAGDYLFSKTGRHPMIIPVIMSKN